MGGDKMMNIGLGGIILITFVTLLFVGPKKLPELSRTIGISLKSFREGINDNLVNNDEQPEKDNANIKIKK